MAPAPRYQVYGLDETYPYLGKFSFKIVLNPRFFKSGQEFDVQLIDSSRRLMNFELKKWGRKLNITFTIDQSVPDGVATAIIDKGDGEIGRLTFWVIKPD
jgi:hypothetical protein